MPVWRAALPVPAQGAVLAFTNHRLAFLRRLCHLRWWWDMDNNNQQWQKGTWLVPCGVVGRIYTSGEMVKGELVLKSSQLQ